MKVSLPSSAERAVQREILVTSALPYANGPIHLGHMVEYIQTDVWVRFQKLRGHRCYYVCADDTHGTPIMLRAEKEGISPEALIERVAAEHKRDFSGFLIQHDHYHSTHSVENRELVEQIFSRLQAAGKIDVRTIAQLYDPERQLFLPDRYVKGTCPRCAAQEQYGDGCEICGATYRPTELLNPYSAVSGATPTLQQSVHYFFKLADYTEFLKVWTHAVSLSEEGEKQPRLQPEALHKMQEWLNTGLSDWDISRDAPYFGFPIPGTDDKKFFYVWLDAPIGYMASFKPLCERLGLDFSHWFAENSTTEFYHFIGKDILYFHALFWPSILKCAHYRTPTAIYAHGFLTVNGAKMSKSRGTFITAESYLNHLKPEYLRYYLSSKLNEHIEDIDLNLEDFISRVNGDLIGKYLNIASRSASFLQQRFDNRLGSRCLHPLIQRTQTAAKDIAVYYETRAYSRAVRDILSLADHVNQMIDTKKPWILARTEENHTQLQEVCTVALNTFRLLTLYLKPILPALAEAAEAFLNIPPLCWRDSQHLLINHTIKPYEHLMKRVERAQTDAMLNENTRHLAPEKIGSTEPIAPTISIDDFSKIDLRVARILEAIPVEAAQKLIKLTLDVGDGSTKTVFAGIKAYYNPEKLVGRHTLFIANLEARKMKFGVSEGMVLAASGVEPGSEIFLLEADHGARAGMRVR